MNLEFGIGPARGALGALALLCAVLAASGCGFDNSALEGRTCNTDIDCTDGYDCVGGYCIGENANVCADAADCDDGVFCNGDEVCEPTSTVAGRDGCAPGAVRELADEFDCTEDICDETSKQVRHIRGVDCICATVRDHQACVAVAAERNLSCVVPTCNDQLGCEFPQDDPGEACGEESGCVGVGECDDAGECQQPLLDSLCDDGDECNGAEVCNPAGVCADGEPVDPDDGIECTADSCTDGAVVNDPAACECPAAGETAGCDQPDNPCLAVVCSESLTCQTMFVEAGADCDDGFACTDVGQCDGLGRCIGPPNDIACSNLDLCDGEEVCDPNSVDSDERGCISGALPNLDDGIDCTDDRCEDNQIIHEPVGCTLCTTDEECVPQDGGNQCLLYSCDMICVTDPRQEGALCDDGLGCTDADACDGNGQCVGAEPDDEFCIDDLFCDGQEVCQPNHLEADADGCRAGLPPDPDDGIECTDDSCVECETNDPNCDVGREGELVHSPTERCECRVDEECPVQTCEVGACSDDDFTCSVAPADVGDPCDDGLECTSGETCNAQQACVPAIDACDCVNDGDCTDHEGNVCLEAGSCDNGQCAYTPAAEGTSCSEVTCAAASECDGNGVCNLVRNNPACAADCRLNALCDPEDGGADEDGCTYDVDPDCLTPDTVIVGGETTGTVGQPSTITVEAQAGGIPLTDQTDNLYCVPRIESYFEGFDEFDVISNIDANDTLHPVGNWGEEDVLSGVNLDGVTGVSICNGKGLVLGPFAQPVATQSLMVRVRMKADELILGDRLVLSIRNGSTGVREGEELFVPMLGIDALDTELREFQFVIFGATGAGPHKVRLEILSQDGSASGTRCAFVDSVGMYAVPNYRFSRSSLGLDGEYVDWTYGQTTKDAAMGFQVSDGDEETIEAEFFSRVENNHTLEITAASSMLNGGNSRGMEWHIGGFGGIGLPVLEGDADPFARDRSEPVRLDWGMSFNDAASWANGDAAEAVLLVGADFNNFAAYRKIATALPPDLPGPYVSQYEVGEPRRHRFVVELPEELKPLVNRRLGFATAGMTGDGDCEVGGCLYLDDIDLYTRSYVGYIAVENSGPQEEGSPVHEVTITSGHPGRVHVQCYWQVPGDPDTPTVASEPHYIEFTN